MTSPTLRPTRLLDFESSDIQRLIDRRQWRKLSVFDRIGAAYAFVRDEIAFGYNTSDSLSASRVLRDGYGQCNTKTTLLMALLRGLDVPTRLHGATIHKRLQKGVVNGLFYVIAPSSIFHTWTEVLVEGEWVGLEGVILDTRYLEGLRRKLPNGTTSFLGFGAGTDRLDAPPIAWRGKDTFIQSTGVNRDFGVYDDPDSFYEEHGDNLSGIRAFVYARWIRHVLNRNVAAIRGSAEVTSNRSQRGDIRPHRAARAAT